MPELKHRDQVDPAHTWDLTTIYATDADWESAYTQLVTDIDTFADFKGKLGEGAKTLAHFFETSTNLDKAMYRLYVYAHLRKDQDTQNPTYQAQATKAKDLAVKFTTAKSFADPELLSIPQATIQAFMKEETSLTVYAHYFDNLWRGQAYVLSPEHEELLAKTGVLSSAPENIYSMLSDADFKFEPALDSNGTAHPLSHGSFITLLESKDRVLRKNAFDNFYAVFVAHKNAIAATHASSVKSDVFYADVRGYDSAQHMALFEDNIPTDIYSNLVNTVNANLGEFHKYIALLKKVLGLSDMGMHDVYVSLVADADNAVTWEQAREHVTKALAPLGEAYTQVVSRMFDERWIDIYENQGKRSGAYSWGAVGTNPFILMNYSDTIDDMFTLAHEIGHSMHSYYSRGTQPYIYSSYTTFLAEIASTVNEALLMDYLVNHTDDTAMQKYLLNYFIEQFRGTFFRQTMFAEFEMLTHQLAENDEPLTGEVLNNLYMGLVEKHFGPDMHLDEKIAYEWSRIPHFYRAFYVFQYATGITSAMAISKAILDGEKTGDVTAKNAYMDLLHSGSHDYSVELLKKAGVDMTTAKPIEDAIAIFSDLVDRFEKVMVG